MTDSTKEVKNRRTSTSVARDTQITQSPLHLATRVREHYIALSKDDLPVGLQAHVTNASGRGVLGQLSGLSSSRVLHVAGFIFTADSDRLQHYT